MNDYHFLKNLFLRSPVYHYNQYASEKIAEIIRDPFFQASLYLASPQLFEAIAGKDFNNRALSNRERLSLMRYYNRMSFRPTPFGSFSSFALCNWGEQGPIDLTGKYDATLHLHIDQAVLLRLAQGLTENETSGNSYTRNPTIYRSGKDFRFIKTTYSEDRSKVFFDLESIESNKLTAGLFAFCSGAPQRGKDIIEHMIKITGCDRHTASDYLTFLIGANMFIPHTAANIIGEDYLNRLLSLPEIPFSAFKTILSTVSGQLKPAHFPDTGYLTSITATVNSLLSGLGRRPEKQVFYAGLERKALSGGLLLSYQSRLKDGLKALALLSQPVQPFLLQRFIQNFKARYDQQKVLLLQAIDPDSGLGYGPSSTPAAETDLMRRVNFTEQQPGKIMLEWSAVHSLLLKRWNETSRTNGPIVLSEDDLSSLPADPALLSPTTLSVLFRIVDDGVYLETVGGATATALIGRFTSWSEEVHGVGRELAIREQAANPDVVFADLTLISEGHTDNINRRRHIYDYEIPINAISTLPAESQIALSDLWISVVGNELVLESEKLQKRVIPRLSSAYNYSRNQLSLFRLLCDLQYQGLQGNYSFDLEQYLPGMAHYPRVMYKNTILSAAVWHISGVELKTLWEKGPAEAIIRFYKFRSALRLPAKVALSKFDQQLVFNLDKEAEVVFLLDCLKLMDYAVLQEFFLPAGFTVSSEGKPLVNQFIAFLYQEEQVYPGNLRPEVPFTSRTGQAFMPGSKWLYLKLYCAPEIANDLLVKKLLPVLRQFKNTELRSWFFIRYRDSGYHIRLRLKIKEDAIGPILTRLRKRLAESVRYHLIREYQADTYRREMERYGADIIGLVEGFFYGSSELVLHYLKAAGKRTFRYTYHSLAFVSVSYLLDNFIPEPGGQLSFLEQMVHTFYAEFSTDKSLKIDLDQKFRELKGEINDLLRQGDYYPSLKLDRQADLYALKITEIVSATPLFSPRRKAQLLADLIHMHLNRLFIDRQRNQELIIYYCLYKHQLGVKAMAKRNT